MNLFRLILPVLLVLLASGCARYEPLSLHGAGTMRVEVEVYKGPLGTSVEGQTAELAGVLADVTFTFDNWQRDAIGVYRMSHCRTDDLPSPLKDAIHQQEGTNDALRPKITSPKNEFEGRDCDALRNGIYMSRRLVAQTCDVIFSPVYLPLLGDTTRLPINTCADYLDIMSHARTLKSCFVETGERNWSQAKQAAAENRECPTLLQDNGTYMPLRDRLTANKDEIVVAVENLATALRASGSRSIDGYLGYVPRSQTVRTALAAFGASSSELGNQISNRVSVLQKQIAAPLDSEIRRASTLPTSDFLRDSRRTDAIHLFDWLDATRGDGGLSRPGDVDAEDRIRMVERLTQGQYWEKVNEVYASGQGKVALAFIKDDLGNWSLKSFSNDPTELLASYRKVSNALLKTAASLATGASGGNVVKAGEKLSLSAKAATLANQVATGESVNPEPAIAEAHQRLVGRIEARQTIFAQRSVTLTQNRDVASARRTQLDADLAGQVALRDDTANAAQLPQILANIEALGKQRVDAEVTEKVAQASLDRLTNDAITDLRELIEAHQDEIISRQTSLAAKTKPAVSAP